MRLPRLLAAALLPLAIALPAAGAEVEECFGPMLHQDLVTSLATECLQANPGMRERIDRTRTGWLKRNEAVMTQWEARYAELSDDRQKAIYDGVMAVDHAFREDVRRAKSAGKGAAYCDHLLGLYDTMAPLAPPSAAPAAATPQSQPSGEAAAQTRQE